MPNLPYDNAYEYTGDEVQPRMSEEESKSFEIGLSYQGIVGSTAWADMLNTLDMSASSAESDWLSVKPGDPYEKRIEMMIVWQQRMLLRRIVEHRAQEMMQYSEMAIKEGITTSHGDPNNRTSYAYSSGSGSDRVTGSAEQSSTDYGIDPQPAPTAATSSPASDPVSVPRPGRRKRAGNVANGRDIQGPASGRTEEVS
jgi:hypothetical protein